REVRGQAGAVVRDGENELVGADVELNGDAFGAAVADGVADGFLGDAVEVGGDGVVAENGFAGAVEGAVDTEGFGDSLGEGIEGGAEAAALEIDGVESVGKPPGLGSGG